MKKMTKRLLLVALCLLLLVTVVPAPADAAEAYSTLPQQHYGDYLTLNMVYDASDCYSIQGVCTDNTYTYCAKINGNDTNAFVMRIAKSDGSKTYMTNASTGTNYFSNLGHANALDTVAINGKQQLFVTGGATLVRLIINGTTLTTAGTYTATYNGATASMTAAQIMSASNTEVKILVKSGRTLYTGTLDPTASSGNIELTKLCTLNVSEIRIKGSVIDFSTFTQQGFDYHDGKVFLPLSGNAYVETINYSIVAVYDLEGAAGDLRNDPSLSFRVISGNYSGLFEIEDVAVCPMTGQLYFSVQRRKTASDTDYDAVSYFYGYTYNPSMSTTSADDFRWETIDNELVSVTDGGNVFNRAERFHGDINNNVMSQSIFSLSRAVVLKHDVPWVVEWKSSGSFGGGAMMLATERTYGVTDAAYLFRFKESRFIAFGAWDGTKHNNYGLTLSDYGIDGTAEHVYRLTNKIASDGSNMVYLSVDGVELGAMNNHYINATAQNTTSDWLNGRDFTFSYIGSYGHPMDYVNMPYLQVWADGIPEDKPDNFRWETTGDALTSATDKYTQNNATMYRGSVADSVYSKAAYRLDNEIVLMHDRPWSVEWQSDGGLTGGTFLLASSDGGNTHDAPFLFRYTDSGLLALGYRNSAGHQNFGIMLSDHGIDGSASHVYRLTNRIAADGSNMVYLFVDDVEIGPMNNYYLGINSQGTTSDWLNGKDLVFDYIGNSSYSLNGTLGYLEVRENRTAHTVKFVNHDGSLISSGEYYVGEMPEVPASPTKAATAQYTYTFAGWDKDVVAVTGDVTYTATYTATTNKYTITFVNEDGKVISTNQVTYGQMPTVPANPTKAATAQYAYTFAGWDKDVVAVTGDATYTATYAATTNKYTITFVNEDGKVISTNQVAYGQMPTIPADPTKAATAEFTYTFAGWDKDVVAVTGDATYTATYTATKINVPAVVPTYPTLAFESEIKYNVYFTVKNLDGVSPEDMGLLIFDTRDYEGTIDNAIDIIPGAVYSNGNYMARTKGISAKNLGDFVYFKVYAKLSDGSYVYSEVLGYNAVAYANTILNKTTSAQKDKALVVAMLNYGAAAQVYFDYKTDALMNAGLSAEQQALVQDYDGAMVEDIVNPDESKVGQFVMSSGYSNIHPTVSFQGAFSINYYFTPKYTPADGVTFYYWTATDYKNADVLTPENATGTIKMTSDNGVYNTAVTGISARQIDETVYIAAVYHSATTGTAFYTRVIAYSLGNYCETLANNGNAFGAATAVYGYYAKQYFS